MGSLAASAVASLTPSMEATIKENFESKLIPTLQNMMSDLVGQLSANLTQAIVESTIEQYKQIMIELTETRKALFELQLRVMKMPSAKELAEEVTQEIRSSLPSMSPLPIVQPEVIEQLDEVVAVDPRKALYSQLERLLLEGSLVEAMLTVPYFPIW